MEAVSKFRELIEAGAVDEQSLASHTDWYDAAIHLVEHGYLHVNVAAWFIAIFTLTNGVIFLTIAFRIRPNIHAHAVRRS